MSSAVTASATSYRELPGMITTGWCSAKQWSNSVYPGIRMSQLILRNLQLSKSNIKKIFYFVLDCL
jgi:hypothetical protein